MGWFAAPLWGHELKAAVHRNVQFHEPESLGSSLLALAAVLREALLDKQDFCSESAALDKQSELSSPLNIPEPAGGYRLHFCAEP